MVSDELVSSAARSLLNTKDVKLWLEHLAEVRNRKSRAAKAAATRQRKKKTAQQNRLPAL